MYNMRKDLIIIASVDRNWGIGKENEMLKPIPEDLMRFAQFTRGNLIVVGRKTLETFPDKEPLIGRINVVLTRNEDFKSEGAVIVHALESLFTAIQDHEGPVFVAGGGTIYRQLLPYCSKALITKIDAYYEADTFLEDLDKAPDWTITHQGEWQDSKAGVRFKYVDYERKFQAK